jgi:hypothetical protein
LQYSVAQLLQPQPPHEPQPELQPELHPELQPELQDEQAIKNRPLSQ